MIDATDMNPTDMEKIGEDLIPAGSPDQPYTLLDLALIFSRQKRLVGMVTLICAVTAALISLLLPNRYTATAAVILPQQNQSVASTMLSSLSGLSAFAGKELGLKNTALMYVSTLQSRTIADRLIDRYDLRRVYDVPYMVEAREKLEKRTEIDPAKEGVIRIAVEDTDPGRAADLANGYVDELMRLNTSLAITEAGQRRHFYEEEVRAEKEQLANAEVELRKTQEATGLIKLDSQAAVVIESIGALRAQVVAKEVEIRSMGSFATESNPQLIRARNELAALRDQLRKMETSQAKPDVLPATGNIPSVGLEYVRKLREVKYHEALFEMLAKQFEIAKIDEAKSTSSLQVLDRAVRPEKKSSPKRSLIVLSAALLGFFGATIFVFLSHTFATAQADPLERHKLTHIRRLWARRQS